MLTKQLITTELSPTLLAHENSLNESVSEEEESLGNNNGTLLRDANVHGGIRDEMDKEKHKHQQSAKHKFRRVGL